MTIKEIQKKVESEYLYEQYEETYYELLNIQLQNKWLKTKAGQDYAGSDNAKVAIERNNRSIAESQDKLAFLKKQIG